jgi:hypothetical protein
MVFILQLSNGAFLRFARGALRITDAIEFRPTHKQPTNRHDAKRPCINRSRCRSVRRFIAGEGLEPSTSRL